MERQKKNKTLAVILLYVFFKFEKTNVIAPFGSQTVHVSFEKKDMASFDDTGATGHAFCYVLFPFSFKIVFFFLLFF